jgi:hypothetical protein
MISPEFPNLQILEGVWLEIRNSKGKLELYPLLESEDNNPTHIEYIALDPIVLLPDTYEAALFNDSTPLLSETFVIMEECILFQYTINRKEDNVSLVKGLFGGTEDAWYEYIGIC